MQAWTICWSGWTSSHQHSLGSSIRPGCVTAHRPQMWNLRIRGRSSSGPKVRVVVRVSSRSSGAPSSTAVRSSAWFSSSCSWSRFFAAAAASGWR